MDRRHELRPGVGRREILPGRILSFTFTVVNRLFTPLLTRLYGMMLGMLLVLGAFHLSRRTTIYKDHLYQQLVSGGRAQKLHAAEELVEVGGQRQLVLALKSRATDVREVATSALWDLWFREAGRHAYEMTARAARKIDRSEFDEGLIELNEIVRLYPDFAEGWNRRATLYWIMGQYEESLSDCQKVLGLKPEHFGAWQGMARCQMHLGDLEGAVFSLRRAVRIQPHDEATKTLLQRCERLLRWQPKPSTSQSERA